MIEYNKLFILLKENHMKKTDLLKIMSPQTLAKLGKGENVQTDIIDKICLFLGCQPNDIMEVYEYKEVEGEKRKIKVKWRDTNAIGSDITYNDAVGITVSELKYVLNEKGYVDMEKLDKLIKKAENH